MTNKTVLITGAARRLGATISRELHAQGMDIIIHYNRSGMDAQKLVDQLNKERANSVHLIQADLSDHASYEKVINDAHGFKNRLDVLINNASTFYPTLIDKVTDEQWQNLIDINMKAPFFLAQKARNYLREHKGCIINMTDVYARHPLAHHAIYSAAKAGLVMLTKALAKEFAPEIRVNAVSPGTILWPENMKDETKKTILEHTAAKRQGEAQDITRTILFLILDANYITGQVLTIDGGRALYI